MNGKDQNCRDNLIIYTHTNVTTHVCMTDNFCDNIDAYLQNNILMTTADSTKRKTRKCILIAKQLLFFRSPRSSVLNKVYFL